MTFAQLNEHTFILNNRLFIKQDFILLLELCGLEVPRDLSREDFLETCEITLINLDGDPVFDRVFSDFQGFTSADKSFYRQLVINRKVPSTN